MTTLTLPVIDDVDFDALESDPYPIYQTWRREAPVARLTAFDSVVISRWDDCERVGKDEEHTDAFNAATTAIFGPNILNIDGDPHKHLRAAVDVPLRPKAVRAYVDELVRPIARDYVAAVKERGSLDATTELLELISVRVVGNVIGIGDMDDLTLQRWFQDMNSGLNNFGRDEEIQRKSDAATGEVDDYTRESLDRLLGSPDETSLSHLLHTATPDGKPRTFDELIGTIRILILGGMQEPGHGAANSLYGLLTDPRQAKAVAEDLSLVPDAIHEGLRWISPFQTVQRRLLADFDFDGVIVPAGQEVQLLVGSANRDESRYEDAERFDISRPRLPVATFGYGPHFCAGHFLAREMERASLEEVFRQLPNVRLDPDRPAKVHGFGVRSVKSLPIVWDA